MPPDVPLPGPYPSGSQVDLLALFNDWLESTGEEVLQMNFIADFIRWISVENFYRLQQPEPVVGGPSSTYPPAVEKQGIKGQSVYTALFHHVDMETFTCKICRHIVETNLEDAIAHQRNNHFYHYPYQCLPNHADWYVLLFFFPWVRIMNTFSIQRSAVPKPSESGGAPEH